MIIIIFSKLQCCDPPKDTNPKVEIVREENRQHNSTIDIDNFLKEKNIKIKDISLDLTKDLCYCSDMFTNNKTEEEEQEESKKNIIKSKKINNEKKLKIEILTPSFMSTNQIIHLLPDGYPESTQYRKDGITYFGITNPDNNTSTDNNVSIFILKKIIKFLIYLVYDRLYCKNKR